MTKLDDLALHMIEELYFDELRKNLMRNNHIYRHRLSLLVYIRAYLKI